MSNILSNIKFECDKPPTFPFILGEVNQKFDNCGNIIIENVLLSITCNLQFDRVIPKGNFTCLLL